MVKRFLDWIVRVKKTSFSILKNRFKIFTENYYSYETIPLKVYFEVSRGNYVLLQLKGRQNIEKLNQVWEEIVKKNAKANESFQYDNFFAVYKSHGNLIQEYTTVKAILMKLAFKVDKIDIEYLKKKGYAINTTTSQKYLDSLLAAIKKSDNLVTRAVMKANELKSFKGKLDESLQTFDSVMADLTSSLGFEVKDEISLARYNELKKNIRKRNEAKLKATKVNSK